MRWLRRWGPWLAVLLVAGAALAIAGGGSGSASPAARAAKIESEVRCPQCEGQSALASDAPAARAVREFVTTQVQAGQSDGQIEQQLQDRYGSDILLRPSSSGIEGLVWIVPVVAFAVAAAGLYLAFRRWRMPAVTATDEDREIVARALEEQ